MTEVTAVTTVCIGPAALTWTGAAEGEAALVFEVEFSLTSIPKASLVIAAGAGVAVIVGAGVLLFATISTVSESES